MKSAITCVLFFLLQSLIAQNDLASWSSFQVKHKVNDKLNVSVKPIIRHNENLGNYLNLFMDFTAAYTINSTWSVGALSRFIVINDADDRNWLFLDIAHSKNVSERINLRNRVRYHHGFDIHIEDPDLMRYETKVTLKKITPKLDGFIAVDGRYRIDADTGLKRMRYMLGGNYKFHKHLSWKSQIWIDDFTSPGLDKRDYILVNTITYNL